jgi:hypothetical protein
LAAQIAPSALLGAIVDLARYFALKSWMAMIWWLSTTVLAQIRPRVLVLAGGPLVQLRRSPLGPLVPDHNRNTSAAADTTQHQ